MTYPVQLNGVDPLLPVLRVLRSEVPHAVVHTYVHSALVKLVRLRQTNPEKWQEVVSDENKNEKSGKYFCANDLYILFLEEGKQRLSCTAKYNGGGVANS